MLNLNKSVVTHTFLLPLLLLSCCKQTTQGDLLIQNVNIIDVEGGRVISQQDVLVARNKIVKIFDHNEWDIRADRTINGEGKYLIPGLWDMHVHTLMSDWYRWQLPLLRTNGIIGFREMWGDPLLFDSIRHRMRNSDLPYFHFVASGHMLDGEMPAWEGSTAVVTPEDGIRLVDSLAGANVDFIKVYSLLTKEVFKAIATRCKQRGIPFAGHVPFPVTVKEASEAGMASMEHLYGLRAEACEYRDSAYSLMEKVSVVYTSGNNALATLVYTRIYALTTEHFSPDKAKEIAQTFKQNNTYIVPTLVALRGVYLRNDSSITNDHRLKYMSESTLASWRQSTEHDLKTLSAADWEGRRKRWIVERQILKILAEENVPILAGSDSDNPYAFPGFSIHDEMALFVDVGMSPLQALQTATLNAAKYLNVIDSLGTIAEGKLADVVLLDGNPLEEIRNTTKINSVIVKGVVYDQEYFARSLSVEE